MTIWRKSWPSRRQRRTNPTAEDVWWGGAEEQWLGKMEIAELGRAATGLEGKVSKIIFVLGIRNDCGNENSM